jgi:regulator of replication initiation timing
LSRTSGSIESRTRDSHLADLRAEVESARTQIADLIRLLNREMSDRRALQAQVDQARERLHESQLAVAAAESRESRHANGGGWPTMQQQAAAAEAMALQMARLWQVWWESIPVRTNGRDHDAP